MPFQEKALVWGDGEPPVCVSGLYLLTDVSLCITHTRCQYTRQESSVWSSPADQFQGEWWFVLCEEQHSSVLRGEHSWKEHSMLLWATRWETQHEQVIYCNLTSCTVYCHYYRALVWPGEYWKLPPGPLNLFFFPLHCDKWKKPQLWVSYRTFNLHLSKSVVKKFTWRLKYLSHSIAAFMQPEAFPDYCGSLETFGGCFLFYQKIWCWPLHQNP